jgi:mono/diheme cytochrome c family protein
MNYSDNPTDATITYNNEFKAVISKASVEDWRVQLYHATALKQGTTYTICFDAKAEAARTISYDIDAAGSPDYGSLIKGTQSADLTASYQPFRYTFAAETSDDSARLAFNLGKSAVGVSLDNIGLFEGNNCGSYAAATLPGVPPVAIAATAFIGNLANGKSTYDTKCASCHGVAGAGVPALNTNAVVRSKNGTAYSLEGYIAAFMPEAAPGTCSGQCAADVAAYVKAGFTVPTKATCSAGTGVVCEDFEEATINSRWTSVGTVELSTEEKLSGSKSLKVSGAGGKLNFNGVDLDLSAFTSLTKNHYGRLMLKTPAVEGNAGDFTFVEASGPANLLATSRLTVANKAIYRARVDGANESFMANYDTSPYGAPLTDCYSHANHVAVPKNTWACFEWRFDASTNTLTYWLNGTKLDMSVKDKAVGAEGIAGCAGHPLDDIWSGPSAFNKLHIGVDQYHDTSKPRTVYIDDVVVDAERVNCPPAP